MKVLITRPAADAAPLAEALAALGIESVVAPMLAIRPRPDASTDLTGVQGLLFTSANGVRAFAGRSADRGVAVFAVGEATARAAAEAGFTRVAVAGGDVVALAQLVRERADRSAGKLVHVAGSAVAGNLVGLLEVGGFRVQRRVFYDSVAATGFSPNVRRALHDNDLDGVLFFSPRTARTFASLVDEGGLNDAYRTLHAYCLSIAVADEIGDRPWAGVSIAAHPTQQALLDLFGADGGDPRQREEDPPMTDDSSNAANEDPAALRVIAAFGGIRPMATKLDVAVTTVQGWKDRASIPAAGREAIEQAAAEHGIEIAAADLDGMSDQEAGDEQAADDAQPSATEGTEAESGPSDASGAENEADDASKTETEADQAAEETETDKVAEAETPSVPPPAADQGGPRRGRAGWAVLAVLAVAAVAAVIADRAGMFDPEPAATTETDLQPTTSVANAAEEAAATDTADEATESPAAPAGDTTTAAADDADETPAAADTASDTGAAADDAGEAPPEPEPAAEDQSDDATAGDGTAAATDAGDASPVPSESSDTASDSSDAGTDDATADAGSDTATTDAAETAATSAASDATDTAAAGAPEPTEESAAAEPDSTAAEGGPETTTDTAPAAAGEEEFADDTAAAADEAGAAPDASEAGGAMSADAEAAAAASAARLDALEQQVAALEGRDIKADTAAALAPIESKLAPIESKLTSLEDKVAALGTSGGEIQSALRAVRQDLDKLAAGAGGIAPVANVRLIFDVSRLRRAVVGGQTYAAELAPLKAALASDTKAGGAIDTLAAHADKGVPSSAAIGAGFGAVADAILSQRSPLTGGDWFDAILVRLQSIVTVRRMDGTPGIDNPGAVVTATRAALAAGDLATAVSTLSVLEPMSLPEVDDWLAEARARLAVDGALDTVEDAVAGSVGASDGGGE